MIRENKNVLIQFSKRLFTLVALSIFAIFLLGARFFIAPSYLHLFFIWNLFLAWVPVAVAWLAYEKISTKNSIWTQAAILIVWLIFLPNAPYIITDYIHLAEWHIVPVWYDLVLTSVFVWAGLQLYFLALELMQHFWQRVTGSAKTAPFVITVTFFSSVGIYIGRYLRWNSWDILAHPVLFAGSVANSVFNPHTLIDLLGFTIILSALLLFGYFQIALLHTKK